MIGKKRTLWQFLTASKVTDQIVERMFWLHVNQLGFFRSRLKYVVKIRIFNGNPAVSIFQVYRNILQFLFFLHWKNHSLFY